MTTEKPDEDDAELFREAMRGVKRLHSTRHVTITGKALSTRPRQSEADEREALKQMLEDPDPEQMEQMEGGDVLLYRAPGVQDGVLRKLRRGTYRMERELDLHGLNREQAKLAVARFLQHCKDNAVRAVRIIHGKGNGSPNSGPVIKALLDGWLRKRHEVLAFCSARPVDGGTGAVYVLLRVS